MQRYVLIIQATQQVTHYNGAQVVIIDEGTAHLDVDSETAIQLVLRNAFRSATVLLIAHRTTSLHNTDRIVVMQAGRIVEQGAAVALAADEASVFHSMLMNQRADELAPFRQPD